MIVDDCRELAVSLYPAGGFSSISFAYDAVTDLEEEIELTGKPAHVIYIGDHDPAGVLIDRSLEAEYRRHLPDDLEVTFHRLAITQEQIALYDLPTKPRKATDRRALHIRKTVEAEAMPAAILRKLLRDKIESFLPAGAIQATRAAEESERRHLTRWAELMAEGGP